MESHLLQMRGLKQCWDNDKRVELEGSRIFYRCVD